MSYLSEDTFEKHLDIIDRSPYVSVDTEGTLNHPHSQTWGLSYSSEGYSEYFAFRHGVGNNLPQHWLPKLIEAISKKEFLVFHNAKHDLQALRNLGLDYKGKFYCTMLMVHMINENLPSKSLDYVSRHYGGDPKRSEEIMKKIIDVFGWEYIPVDLIRPYGSNDAYITDELFRKLLPEFRDQGFDGELWEWEQDFCRALIAIENPGILIDQDLSAKELDRGLKTMKTLEKGLGFNPASTKQLGAFLLDELGLPVLSRTDNGNPSFKKENMEIYDEILSRKNDKRASQVLTYRGWQKTTSSNYKSYLEKLGPDGKIRCNYWQHGTRNGRCSCKNPNLQQIPRASKKDWNGNLKPVFVTEKGRVRREHDFSQLEFRVGAAYGQEARLIEIFNDPDRDLFTEMALDLRGMTRDDVKTMSYTIQFGGGADRVSTVFGMSWQEARARINNYYKTYPGLAKITSLAQQRAKDNGYIKMWSGRRRHLYGEETRKAFSSLCQGGGFEIVKRAIVTMYREGITSTPECFVDLQVHDSAVTDIEEGKEHIYEPEIKRVMEDVKRHFPFGVDFRIKSKAWGA